MDDLDPIGIGLTHGGTDGDLGLSAAAWAALSSWRCFAPCWRPAPAAAPGAESRLWSRRPSAVSAG